MFISSKGTESNQILTQHILPTVSYYAVHPSLPTFVIFVAKHPIRGTVTDRAIYLVESENAYNISDLLSQFWFYRHKNKIIFTFGHVFPEQIGQKPNTSNSTKATQVVPQPSPEHPVSRAAPL